MTSSIEFSFLEDHFDALNLALPSPEMTILECGGGVVVGDVLRVELHLL